MALRSKSPCAICFLRLPPCTVCTSILEKAGTLCKCLLVRCANCTSPLVCRELIMFSGFGLGSPPSLSHTPSFLGRSPTPDTSPPGAARDGGLELRCSSFPAGVRLELAWMASAPVAGGDCEYDTGKGSCKHTRKPFVKCGSAAPIMHPNFGCAKPFLHNPAESSVASTAGSAGPNPQLWSDDGKPEIIHNGRPSCKRSLDGLRNQAWVLKKSLRSAAENQRKRVRRIHALLDFDGWRLADHDGTPPPG